jgi:hypothetical protein
MRAAFIGSLLLGFCLPLAAAGPEIPASPPVEEPQSVQIGSGVVLPRTVFEEIMAREDGLAVIERMQMEPQPVQLGGGVVLPKPIFEEIMARKDGLAVIERMQQRAREERDFEGVPHLVVIFVSVLLFFWSTMFYYQRKHARLHRTIQSMVEKGVPIPPEILRAAEEVESGIERSPGAGVAPIAPAWASNVLWGGLLWITIGIAGGLYLYLRGNDAWPWALAAVIYGAASVITAIGKRDARR